MERLQSCAVAPKALLDAQGAVPDSMWQWPFVSCFGRSDGAVTVAAANVYPHMLQHVFAASPHVSHFRIAVEGGGGSANRFVVYVELAQRANLSDGAAARLKRRLHDGVVGALSRVSSEYRESLVEAPQVADPTIVLVPYASGMFAEDAGRQKRSHIHTGTSAPSGRGGEQ